MSMSVPRSGGKVRSTPAARAALTEDHGWSRARACGGVAWCKGWVAGGGRCLEGTQAAGFLAGVLDGLDADAAGSVLAGVRGHFAVVLERADGSVLAAVDRVRSIPLAYAEGGDGWLVDDRAERLRVAAGAETPDAQAGLELAMAGYTLGPDTLFAGVKQLQTGELVLFSPGRAPRTHRYDLYRAWKVQGGLSRGDWMDALGDVTTRIFTELAEGLDGRRVMLPLSAGLDSRLVASGLAHVGYDNVHCYAYGLPGNFEAEASREIAARLGYPWTFVPYRRADVARMARGATFARYLEFADSLCSVPFVQDFLAVKTLAEDGTAPPDAVFINGNSGDFISGAHIQPAMRETRTDLDPAGLRDLVLDTALAKHFALWDDLAVPDNLARVRARLAALLDAAGAGELAPDTAHGAYECLECQSRQAKFVITGQRVYEFFGFGWRLPLWDVRYLDLWQGVPLEHKVGQNLYADWLHAADWGGVWKDFSPRRWVSPGWIRPARAALKLACAPLGRRRWHAVEKRVLTYFTDILHTHATVPVPYARFLTDQRGFRHSMALRCEDYLRRKGRGTDGGPA